jgi:hypothetical protein
MPIFEPTAQLAEEHLACFNRDTLANSAALAPRRQRVSQSEPASRGAIGSRGSIVVNPNRENGVSREGDDIAVVPNNDVGQDGEAIVDKICETLGSVAERSIGPRGKAGDIDQQYCGTTCIRGWTLRLGIRTQTSFHPLWDVGRWFPCDGSGRHRIALASLTREWNPFLKRKSMNADRAGSRQMTLRYFPMIPDSCRRTVSPQGAAPGRVTLTVRRSLPVFPD